MAKKEEKIDSAIQQKTEWVRKQDRIQFFTNDVSNTDYFECMKASARSLKEKTAFDGWLTKQGGKGLGVNWRRRWFILTYDKYLYYYKSPEDEGPLGVICLDNYEAVSLPVEDGKKKYRFSIHNNNKSTIRVFHLYSDTLQESLQWVSTIDQVFKAPKVDNTKTKIIKRDIERETNLGIRRDARLYIRVVEARKFQRTTSCYCIIDMDSQQVRTQTIWKTKEPMWSEEFYLDVYGDIDQISVVVTCWKMQKAGKGNALGKVEVPLSLLSDQKQHEEWHPLVHADSDKYIAGEVHLKIEYKPSSGNTEEGILFVQVVGAKNLAPKGIGGTSNPFIRLFLGKKKKKTKTIYKTLAPSFNDFFEFKVNLSNPNEKDLNLIVYHRDKLANQFLGKVSIPFHELEPNFLYDIWYTVTDDTEEEEDVEDEEEEIKDKKKEIKDITSTTPPSSSLNASISKDDIKEVKFSETKEIIDTEKEMEEAMNSKDQKDLSSSSSSTPSISSSSEENKEEGKEEKRDEKNDKKDNLSSSVAPSTRKERPNWVASHRSSSSLSTGGGSGNNNNDSNPSLNNHNAGPLSVSMGGHIETSSGRTPSPKPLVIVNSGNNLLSGRSKAASKKLPTGTLKRVPNDSSDTLRSSLSSSSSSSSSSSANSKEKEIGDIRIVLKYTEQMVLPISEYEELYELLLENNFEVIHLLGSVTTEKDNVGRTLCSIFESRGKAVELITSLATSEIESTINPDVIFRENTIATKTLDYYMKLIGLPYLHKTLGSTIEEIYKSKKSCEVDPTRLEKTDDLAKNFASLLAYVEEATSVIFTSDCPHKLRRIFHNIQEKVKSRYPEEQIQVVKYTAVSGFIFLRFFCPAILGPKLFDLMKEHPEMRVARTLTLIAKTLQNLSNLCEFGYKEMYMADMNKFILDKMNDVKEFIDAISTLPDAPRREESPPIDFGREMATIHQHLANNLKSIQEIKEKSAPAQKLAAVLRRLETVRERYELEL